MQKRMGELLSESAHITRQDIEEILQEQVATGRRFGAIALSWGLCRPEQVWQAWYDQLSDPPQRINLDGIGIDTQALAQLSREVACRLRVVPIRMIADQLLLAVDDRTYRDARRELSGRMKKRIKFVLADEEQIDQAIELHYAPGN